MPAQVPAADIPVSQSNYYASAGPMAPASGLQGSLSGPWLVESQDMQVEYTRVPNGYLQYQITTLSSVSATQYQHTKTRLNCLITANYSRKKTYDTYTNESFQQPQKFQVYALSADENDTSYGTLNASCLGPAGTIVSYQPYLSRRLWNDNLDSEIASSVTVANFAFVVSAGTGFTSLKQTDPDAIRFQYNFIDSMNKGTPLNNGEPFAQDWGYYTTTYSINGPYTVEKETKSQMISFIDAVGGAMTAEYLLKIPATLHPTYAWGMPDTGLPEYSKYRHDYN